MKSITMFVTSWCPYCKLAHRLMDELKQLNPNYKELNIKIIDEEKQPELAKQYDYYYVPTYFIDDNKVHEGVPNIEIIKGIFDKASSI